MKFSRRGCGQDHSTEGSFGEVLPPAVCSFCDDLGSSQFLTKFYEFLSSTALQFDAVSLLQMCHEDLPPQLLSREGTVARETQSFLCGMITLAKCEEKSSVLKHWSSKLVSLFLWTV